MPATQVSYVGLDMDLYQNTGTFSTPIWTIIPNVRDLKRGSSMGEADVSIRGTTNPRLMLKEPTLQEYTFEWDMIHDETDTNFTLLRTAKDNRTPIEFAFANGPIGTSGTSASGGVIGSVYFRIETKIFGFDDDEPLEGAVTTHVTAKPCKLAATNAPSVNTVTT